MLVFLLACSTPPPEVEEKALVRQPPSVRSFPDALEGAPLAGVAEAGVPDIILVSVDTLRADHLGSYGYSRDTSPFIDSLAASGVRFEHARSPSSWTLPSHTTMLTGQLPTTHRVVEDTLKLSVEVPVLPELLHQGGYATSGVVSTLFVSSKYGFERGFHHFQDFGILEKKLNLAGLVQMDDVVEEVGEYLKSVPKERPLFLFLHTYDAHYAYDPPPPYDTMFDRAPREDDPRYRSYGYYRKNPPSQRALKHEIAQYDESIRWIDDQLLRLSKMLKAAGRNPRWVITADHGEEFGERGSWGHGHTLYAEQLRVPLIMSGPGLPVGKVVKGTVGTQDLAPTLASWAGVSGLKDVDGLDLSPHLEGTLPVPARPFLSETSRHRTLRYGLWEGGERIEWDVLTDTVERFTDGPEKTALPDEGMKDRLVALLGQPWAANVEGTVRVHKGRAGGPPFRPKLAVKEGQRFAVLPFDASFRMVTEQPGPAVRLADPLTPSFTWKGGIRPVAVDLDQDTLSALEALGYVHD